MPTRSTDHRGTVQPVVRVLTPADPPIANRLVQTAGWNQTSRDWLRLLAYEPGLFGDGLFGDSAFFVKVERIMSCPVGIR